MGEHKYNIDEASRLSGISVRSLRNYVNHYSDYLSLKRGQYNALLFSDGDLTVLVKVKSLLRDGKSRQEIIDILAKEELSPSIEVTRTTTVPATEKPVLLPLLKKIDTVLTQLLEENKQLHERLADMEQQLARTKRALPAAVDSDRRKPMRSSLELPIPYFVLAAKDGCSALLRSLWTVFVAPRATR